MSLLNVGLKIISKALSEKLNNFLPDLISSQPTAYVESRHIGETGRLHPFFISNTFISNIMLKLAKN